MKKSGNPFREETERREADEDRGRASLDWLGDNRRQQGDDRREPSDVSRDRAAPAPGEEG